MWYNDGTTYFGAFMNSHSLFNERKAILLSEYMNENKGARRGKRIVNLSLAIILVSRILLALFEFPVFIIQGKPLNLLAVLLLLPLLVTVYIVYKGAKGFAYVTLVSPTLRLILYFAFVYKSMPQDSLTEVYTFTLFAILLLQFILSIIILASYDCDTYFTAIQRINMKVHGEEMLKQNGR